MDMHSDDVERWLISEERGDEQAAEAAFAHLFAVVPRIEPQPGFVERVSAAAWRSRQRRHETVRAARAAAVLLVASAGIAAAWLALRSAWPWLVTSGAVVMASASLGGVVTGAVTAVEWWATVARVAVVIGETLARREAAGVLLAVEVVGALALYVLHQLIRSVDAKGTWWEVRT
jgi:hypothetical protein